MCHQKQHLIVEARHHRAMKNDNIVKTTWRIPPDLYAELLAASERDGVSVNAVGIERLKAASASERFDRLDRDMTALKQLMREMLDQMELKR